MHINLARYKYKNKGIYIFIWQGFSRYKYKCFCFYNMKKLCYLKVKVAQSCHSLGPHDYAVYGILIGQSRVGSLSLLQLPLWLIR